MPHYIYVTMAMSQVMKIHGEGFLGKGDHHEIIEQKYREGYRYVGWIPTALGLSAGQIKEVELIFENMEE